MSYARLSSKSHVDVWETEWIDGVEFRQGEGGRIDPNRGRVVVRFDRGKDQRIVVDLEGTGASGQ